MQRRRLLVGPVCAVAAGLAALVAVLSSNPRLRTSSPAPDIDRPDLLLIVVDALRADRLALYGYARQTTPQLTARRGRLRWFTNVVTDSTHTVPAVASLFTGVPPRRHHLQYDNIGLYFPGYGATPLLDSAIPTLAEALRGTGYDTRAMVGTPWLGKATGFDRGFSRFDGWKIWDRQGATDDAAMVRAAVDWLIEPAGRPRLAWVHLMSVHSPYDKGHRDLVRGTGKDRYVNGLRSALPADLTFMSDMYDSNVLYVDGLLGTMFDRLSARPRGRPVVVCVVGDHGDEFLEHGGFGHGTTVFDELARVPAIVWGPGLVDRHGASSYPLQLSDIRGMLLALAGAAKEPLAGLLVTSAREPTVDAARTRSIELHNEKAVYQAPWKDIVTRMAFRERLFNLERDPAELMDRSADARDVLARLRAEAQRLWPDIRYPGPGDPHVGK